MSRFTLGLRALHDTALRLALGHSLRSAAMALLSPLFPAIYNTTATVKSLAASMLLISAVLMPVSAFSHCAYFTLRSGGKSLITFLFDCGFMWIVNIPMAFILSRFTAVPILRMYLYIHLLELVKSFIGALLLRSRIWVNNLVRD